MILKWSLNMVFIDLYFVIIFLWPVFRLSSIQVSPNHLVQVRFTEISILQVSYLVQQHLNGN